MEGNSLLYTLDRDDEARMQQFVTSVAAPLLDIASQFFSSALGVTNGFAPYCLCCV